MQSLEKLRSLIIFIEMYHNEILVGKVFMHIFACTKKNQDR